MFGEIFRIFSIFLKILTKYFKQLVISIMRYFLELNYFAREVLCNTFLKIQYGGHIYTLKGFPQVTQALSSYQESCSYLMFIYMASNELYP